MAPPAATGPTSADITIDLRDALPELAERLGRGETVTLLHNGRRLATASPVSDERRRLAGEAFQELIEIGDEIRRQGRGFTAEELKQFRDEGRL